MVKRVEGRGVGWEMVGAVSRGSWLLGLGWEVYGTRGGVDGGVCMAVAFCCGGMGGSAVG